MGKVVLVMDMPRCCDECSVICEQYYSAIRNENFDNNMKPDNCPLRELPKKIGIEEAVKMPRNGCISDVINSYNACIDELLKEE